MELIARRRIVLGLLTSPFVCEAVAEARPIVEVWKWPTCSCCKHWVSHLEANGFKTRSHDTGNNSIRLKLGLPVFYDACHTAAVAGYAIEGHVPAREIHRLLAERPPAIGLAVPGMPLGSPGMKHTDRGQAHAAYDVFLIGPDGVGVVFQSYR